MNLIEESFQTKKEDKSKKTAKMILIVIAVLIILIIGLFTAVLMLQEKKLVSTIDGKVSKQVNEYLVFENDGTIYASVKDIAPLLGYQAYNGEYTNKSETNSKCYVQNENEVANINLNSREVKKLNLEAKDSDYENSYMKKPVKAINGKLYISSDALEQVFNSFLEYDEVNKTIKIYSLTYLISLYQNKVLDYGYAQVAEEFTNQKTILQDMIVVLSTDKKYGVIKTNGDVVLEPKYDSIEYLPTIGDFLVESGKKYGVISAKKDTKLQLSYESINLIYSDENATNGLYVVSKDKKYGVVDLKGNTIIHIENEQIGIEAAKFEANGITDRYILMNKFIPVQSNKKWKLYTLSGKLVDDAQSKEKYNVTYEFDSLGYLATSNKNAENLLVIPDYNVLVVCQNEKYALLNSSGQLLCNFIPDAIYMTISNGNASYHIAYNDQDLNAEEFLQSIGAKIETNASNKTTTNTNNTNSENTNTNANTNTELNNTSSEIINNNTQGQQSNNQQ